jgi:hypothetical protein
LDGGGMRGLIAARILTRLEHLIQVNSWIALISSLQAFIVPSALL